MHACSTAHRSLRAHTIGAPRPPCTEPRSLRTAHTRTPRAAPGRSAAGLCGPRAPSPGRRRRQLRARRRRNGRALPRSSPAPGTHLRGKTERSRRGASQPSLALGTGPPAPRAGSRAPSPFLQHRAVAPRRSALPSAAAPSPHAVLAPGARLWRPGCTPPRASACPGTDVRGLWVRQRVALCPARGPPAGLRSGWRSRARLQRAAVGTVPPALSRAHPRGPGPGEPRAPRGRGPRRPRGQDAPLSSPPLLPSSRPGQPSPCPPALTLSPTPHSQNPLCCAPLRGCSPPGPQPTPQRCVCSGAQGPPGRRAGAAGSGQRPAGMGRSRDPAVRTQRRPWLCAVLCCAAERERGGRKSVCRDGGSPTTAGWMGSSAVWGTGMGLKGLGHAGGAHALCPLQRHQALPAATPSLPPRPPHPSTTRGNEAGAHPGAGPILAPWNPRSCSAPPRGALPAPGGVLNKTTAFILGVWRRGAGHVAAGGRRERRSRGLEWQGRGAAILWGAVPHAGHVRAVAHRHGDGGGAPPG